MDNTNKVLHVVESFGGGVATALAQYASATPSVEHHLLRAERSGDFIDGGELDKFATVRELPRRPFAARRMILRTIRELSPSVVHAHSSIAGAYVRLFVRATDERAIIYTPHGYSFERKDVNESIRRAYHFIEWLLARNTTAYAACSKREAELSRFAGFAGRVVHVPNVSTDPPEQGVAVSRRDAGMGVISVGRLTPARDPYFFAEVVRNVHKRDPSVRFTWVGGGDTSYGGALKDLGVQVTGWLSRHEAMAYVRAADAHIHTSSWDGFPMVLLEANAMRVPSLVRDIEPFVSVPLTLRSETPEEMAEKILEMRHSSHRRLALDLWDEYLSENTAKIQAERLMSLYETRLVRH